VSSHTNGTRESVLDKFRRIGFSGFLEEAREQPKVQEMGLSIRDMGLLGILDLVGITTRPEVGVTPMPPIKRRPDLFAASAVQLAIRNIIDRDLSQRFPESAAEVTAILARGTQGLSTDEDVLEDLVALRNRLQAGGVTPLIGTPGTRFGPPLAPPLAPLALPGLVPTLGIPLARDVIPAPVGMPFPLQSIGPLVVLPPGVDPANVLVVTQRFPVGRSVGFVAGGRTLIPVIHL